MHRDNSPQELVSQFSFIESLDLSKDKSSSDRPSLDSSIVATVRQATTLDTKWNPPKTDIYSLSLAELIRAASHETTAIPDKGNTAQRNYLGKLLFALSCSYCLFVLWWLFGHQGNRLLTILTGGEQVVLSKSDVQFIDYMERSLAKIDRQQADVQREEVVYVPVYTPTPAPSPPQIPAVSYNPPPTATPITPEAIKIPAPPPLPAPTPVTADSVADSPTAIASDRPPVIRTLLGILELGEDSSAALIKVGSQTRRVAPGEQMSDGLILQSLGDSKATISDRGIIRSISVGETF